MLFELRNVSKTYMLPRGGVKALANISMQIEEGELLVIMGPSGSGKTTLLNLIGCLDLPTKGDLLVKGKNIKRLSDEELTQLRKEEIGFVFQQYNLIPTLSALENVELPMILRRMDRKEIRARALALLASIGIPQKLSIHKPSELSGGEQQRLAIARALANDPSILVADEPTGNVDSHTTEEIMGVFKRINEEGRTVIVVTHDPLVAEFAKRKLRIEDGRIEDGAKS
jgi:putative ABC transport system ATP-binding protein